jgi:hypothetical protein
MIVLAGSPLHSFALAFGGGFAAIGLVFLVIGVALTRTGRRFQRRAERAEGRIVGYDTSDPVLWRFGRRVQAGPGWFGANPVGDPAIGVPASAPVMPGEMYRPIVVFETREGQAVRATSRIGANPRPGRVGDTVTVFYDPQEPQRVHVDVMRRRAACIGAAFILLGGVAAALGLAVLAAAR